MTAGIAHEIKNPLNFVNNFAELSGELLEEFAGNDCAGGGPALPQETAAPRRRKANSRERFVNLQYRGRRPAFWVRADFPAVSAAFVYARGSMEWQAEQEKLKNAG